MKKTFQVENVKCGGCGNTLKKALKEDFGEVEVNLEVHPREITLDLEEGKEQALKQKLISLGYPFSDEKLGAFQKASTTAKSFVSCAIGKMS
ncbi:MAG: heavy-metal-associated domain-containing protein [Arcobacter sp.]|nr:heavy-metal-associated domain-containing protein [Arcobacter sp.]